MNDLVETIKTVGAALVGIAIVLVVVGSVVSFAGGQAATGAVDDGVLTTQDGTGSLALDSTAAATFHRDVQTSLGTAVELGAGDSVTAEGDLGLNVQTEQWTLCTFARPNADADNVSSTVLKYDEAAIVHNGTSDTYRGYYYDKGTRSAVDAEVAVNGTETQKLVCLSRDGTSVTLTRNTTASDSVALDTDSDVAAPPNTAFNGTVEETRAYGRVLTTTNKSTIVGEPTGAIEGAAPAFRLMYDARSTSQTEFRVFFAGETAIANGATVVDSFPGEPIESGVDYEFGGAQNATLSVIDGGELRPTGEIVYATFGINKFGGIINRLISVGATAFSLLALGVLVLAARKVNEFVGGSGF